MRSTNSQNSYSHGRLIIKLFHSTVGHKGKNQVPRFKSIYVERVISQAWPHIWVSSLVVFVSCDNPLATCALSALPIRKYRIRLIIVSHILRLANKYLCFWFLWWDKVRHWSLKTPTYLIFHVTILKPVAHTNKRADPYQVLLSLY